MFLSNLVIFKGFILGCENIFLTNQRDFRENVEFTLYVERNGEFRRGYTARD